MTAISRWKEKVSSSWNMGFLVLFGGYFGVMLELCGGYFGVMLKLFHGYGEFVVAPIGQADEGQVEVLQSVAFAVLRRLQLHFGE